MSFSRFSGFRQLVGSYKTYELSEALLYEVGRKGSGWSLVLEPGTQFDISVPRGLEWALSPHDKIWLPPAAIHDELLKRGYDAAFAAAEMRRAGQARIDREFKDTGKRDRRAWLIFFAVLFWTTRPRWLRF